MFNLSMIQKSNVKDQYEVIIIGAGPAGYSAGIYLKRFNKDVLIIGDELGGMASEAVEIENYPGFKKISGKELMERFKEHAESLGVDILHGKVVKVEKQENEFIVTTDENKKIKAKAIIFATGSAKRRLNVPREDEFIGKGVSYCAICDAAFFKDKVVAVVGGGDSAMNDALILSNLAKKVYLIHRRDEFRAAPQWVNKVKDKENVEFILNSVVVGLEGDDKLRAIIIETKKDKEGKEKEQWKLDVDGLFISIGVIPSTDLAKELGVELDERNTIIVDEAMRTNVPGVFAAGDCTTGSARVMQIITAAAEGAIAAESAVKYLHGLEH